jgi:hypothetical protein
VTTVAAEAHLPWLIDQDGPAQLRLVKPPSIEELLHWATFLDQGDARSPLRRESVAALLEVAEHDPVLLHAAWTSGLRALQVGSMTRSSVDLVRAALDIAHTA